MAVAFRASSSATADTNSINVVLPGSVQAGDALLIVVGVNVLDTISTPSGWTLLDSRAGGSSRFTLYGKTAVAGDAGATVNFTTATSVVKMSAFALAWSGADTATPFHRVAGVAESTSQATHVTPTVTTTIDGCLIAQMAMVKSSGATSWTESTGLTERVEVLHTGSAPNGAAAGDGIAEPAGTYGGAVFTSDVAGGQGGMWTVAIAPAVTSVTVRPVSDVTTAGWTAVPAVGSGVPISSNLADSNDATYVESQANATNQVFESKYQTPPTPLKTVTTRVSTAGGAASMSVKTELYMGATLIASWPPETVLVTSPTTFTYSTTTAQQGAQTDPTNLRKRVTVTVA